MATTSRAGFVASAGTGRSSELIIELPDEVISREAPPNTPTLVNTPCETRAGASIVIADDNRDAADVMGVKRSCGSA
jgi:hypothetical protein